MRCIFVQADPFCDAPWDEQTDGLYDNVFQKHWIALLEHVDKMLDAPENKFLLPLEKEKERARLFADVLVVYGKMMMGREDLVSPFEGRSRLGM